MGYDTETHDFYFCENCGKEKWVESPNSGAKMDAESKVVDFDQFNNRDIAPERKD